MSFNWSTTRQRRQKSCILFPFSLSFPLFILFPSPLSTCAVSIAVLYLRQKLNITVEQITHEKRRYWHLCPNFITFLLKKWENSRNIEMKTENIVWSSIQINRTQKWQHTGLKSDQIRSENILHMGIWWSIFFLAFRD